MSYAHKKTGTDNYGEEWVSVSRLGFKKLLEKENINASEGELSVWMKIFDPLERN
jgi:hypothetical protein